jgi:hypothetical protein
MGCDIHVWLEHREKNHPEYTWGSFGGEMNPGRNYAIFGKIAGLRGGDALIEPRGFPNDAGYEARRGNETFISDNADIDSLLRSISQKDGGMFESYLTLAGGKKFLEEKLRSFSEEPHSVSPEEANGWVEKGDSKYVYDSTGKTYAVTSPDWHSHTWLTPDEFEATISDFPEETEYQVILDCMRSFEKRGHDARVLIFFDN